MTEFTFAHLTDLHLPILAPPHWRTLMNKRALGYSSWRRKRCKTNRLEPLEALVADIQDHSIDASFITGDLVNLALPAEFCDAKKWLDQRFEGMDTVFVPGNHDTYVRAPWSQTLGTLSDRMVGTRLDDARKRPPSGPDDFPFIKKYHSESKSGNAQKFSIAIVSANSSPPTAPGLATGTLGDAQISRIEAALTKSRDNGDFRVLLLHHPVNDNVVSARKALTDRDKLREIIARVGVDLVLHGHAHIPLINEIETPTSPAPVLGGGSASHSMMKGAYRPACYNLIAVKKEPRHWSVTVQVRELDLARNTLFTVKTLEFNRPLT